MSWENIVKNQYNDVLSEKIMMMSEKSRELWKLMKDLMYYVSKNGDDTLLEMIIAAAKESNGSYKTMDKILQYVLKREGAR